MLESQYAAPRVYLDYAARRRSMHVSYSRCCPSLMNASATRPAFITTAQEAEQALDHARSVVARILRCSPSEIIFTSGGTESDNLAIRGAALAAQHRRGVRHILTTPVEHPAVLNACRHLERYHGFEVETLPVDGFGRVDPDSVRRALRAETALVSVIHANNEIGTINPIQAIALVCHERSIPLHTDSVQAAAHLQLPEDGSGADLISIGAHKFYGPKGVGALYRRSDIELVPIQPGGGQEGGHRAGTQNVPLIVGLATAFEITEAERDRHTTRFEAMRMRLADEIPASIPGTRVTGHPVDRLPNHASFVFEGVDGNRLLAALDLAGFECSSASACKTGEPEPSSVLVALGIEPSIALGSLRVTVGRPTSQSEVERFLQALPPLVAAQRRVGLAVA
jgi:cysteine desulfurase